MQGEKQDTMNEMRAQSESIPYLQKLKELAFEKPMIWQKIKETELSWQQHEEKLEWERDMQTQQQSAAVEAAAVEWSEDRCGAATKDINAAELELRLGSMDLGEQKGSD
jgi:hypothetical protein